MHHDSQRLTATILFTLSLVLAVATPFYTHAQIPSERTPSSSTIPQKPKRHKADGSLNLVVEKLPASVSSAEYDEISPVVSRDGRRLFFTRAGAPDYNRNLVIDGHDISDSLNATQYEQLLRSIYNQIGGAGAGEVWRSSYNQDIWMASFDRSGQLEKVDHPGPPLNNALPNALAAAMPEAGHFLVINQFPRKGGMSEGFSHVFTNRDGTYTWPMPVEIEDYYTHGPGVGATISEDGTIMILSIQRQGGYGESDLYVSRRVDSTHWTRPESLGPDINTEFRESTPSLSEDMQTLYFSSNRWGRGGNDIYFCRRLDSTWNNWSMARRFRPPISSEFDDSQPYFNEATGYLYFTSKRDGTSDIYRVRVQKPKPLDILVVGRVRHARTGELMDADVTIRPTGVVGFDTVVTTRNGKFDYRLSSLGDLEFSARKDGFIGHVEQLSLRRKSYLNAYEIDILLDPQEKGGVITLDPIYFEQSIAKVKPKSYPQLERLQAVLEKYPNIYVRIEGHTDNQGTTAALDKLSRERAEAIRDYLLANGIDRTRVQAAGYGGRKPVSENNDEAGREANRRVEVVITRILPVAKPSAG